MRLNLNIVDYAGRGNFKAWVLLAAVRYMYNKNQEQQAVKSLQLLQKVRAYKVAVMEEVAVKKISTKKKSSTFL